MKKTAMVLALVGATGYGAYRWISSDDAKPAQTATLDGEQLVLDRIWIDHMPKNDRDTIQFFAAITEEPFGVFQAASSWKGQYELFRYQTSGNELHVTYPQTGDRETVKHKARRCSDNGMDYCLELDGGRGVKKYYSRKGWEIDGAASAEDVTKRIDSLVHTLAHDHGIEHTH